MQAALGGVGSGPLRGASQAAEPPSGCQNGFAPCDRTVFNQAYYIPDLGPDELVYHGISRTPGGDFYCALCWRHPADEWQVKTHIQSKDHLKRIGTREYYANPLAFVPISQLDVTKLQDGWATCILCNKRMLSLIHISEPTRPY